MTTLNDTDIISKNVEEYRAQIQDILQGRDKRFLVIVGPCSIHIKKEALEYANLLKIEQEKYKDTLFFIMRTYFQKPRTTIGWEGFSVDPHLDGSYDYKEGIKLSIEICEEITKLGIPIADEALSMELTDKWSQYLSYAALGARNSEDQNMRKYCSHLLCPVGVKHPRSGNLEDGINGVISVQYSNHRLFFKDSLFTCRGNEFAHLILRGNSHQKNGNNISKNSIEIINELYEIQHIKHPSIICDLSHDNCKIEGEKDANLQLNNISKVLELLKYHEISSRLIKGVMIESYLEFGKQQLDEKNSLRRGVSVTDECISFEQTQKIFEELHTYFKSK
ncbi:MAG: 3-deoxy-7-phosphoheptulonate synthase [Nanoarchaeota archaeon]|nr:3-deoxy-7-phosphoheptulonate synthase [Nanoarchaeota archaeon]